MSRELPDQEPTITPGEPRSIAPKGRQSLARVRRELSEEELTTPAVQRLLVEDNERLERERLDLLDYERRFHDVDKRVAILEEKLKKSIAGEVIFGVCLTVGAALLGFSPAVWEKGPTGPLLIVFGTILIVGGIAYRTIEVRK
jgi:hypothetical protein